MMNSLIFLLKNIIFRKNAYTKYLQLLDSDKISPIKLKALNWRKRVEVVKYSYNHIEFYRNLYDANNFHPSMLKCEGDWAKVPVITKEMVRKNFDSIVNKTINHSRHVISSTGGTSGEPLKVLHDKNNYLDVNGWRVMNWWNIDLSPNIAFVFRLTRNSAKKIFLNDLIWFPTKRLFLNASSIKPEYIGPFVSKLVKNNTEVLQGYTGALNEIAIYVIENNIKISCLKAVWCTSSPLNELCRANLKKAFNAEIYDQYGSGEVYWIATECSSHNGLHIHSDIRHVDIVDSYSNPLPNGTRGDILITDLDNYLFPLIKYRNGDMSVKKDELCSCGRPYPLLAKVFGRISDNIRLPNGGFIAGDYFTTIFDNYVDEINKFQVHQLKDYSININIALKHDTPAARLILKTVREEVERKAAGLVEVRCNVVDLIDDVNLGKSRFIISDVR